MIKKLLIGIMLINLYIFSQTKEPDIQKRLDQIKTGKTSEVKKELPRLLNKYPNNPGVMYLQARLTENAEEATKIYNEIYTKYPKSEYAQHALYKLYQYYSIIDNNKKARDKYNQLLKLYPKSKYLAKEKNSSIKKFYYIQIGAFSSDENAKNFSDNIAQLGYKPNIVAKTNDDRTLFLVTIGKFNNLIEAEKYQKSIESKLDITSVIKTNSE
jgi:cell division protein FtsN